MHLQNDATKTEDGTFDNFFMEPWYRETVDKNAILHARMIFYGGEDPATGSAAGPAAAWLLKHGILEPGRKTFIEQGIEMKRPSRIYVQGKLFNGEPTEIRVGGYCFHMGSGQIMLNR